MRTRSAPTCKCTDFDASHARLRDTAGSQCDFLWLTRGAFGLVEAPTDKPKTVIASSWTRSANVNSVRLEESPHESKTLYSILDSECHPSATLYHSMEEHLTVTGHALFALRSDLLRWDPDTLVDMMDVFPGSDTENNKDDSGFLRGPSDGMQSRLVSIFVRNLLHCQEYRYYSTVCNVLCTELVLLCSHVIIDSLGLYAAVGKVLREEGCRVVAVDTTNIYDSKQSFHATDPLHRNAAMWHLAMQQNALSHSAIQNDCDCGVIAATLERSDVCVISSLECVCLRGTYPNCV